VKFGNQITKNFIKRTGKKSQTKKIKDSLFEVAKLENPGSCPENQTTVFHDTGCFNKKFDTSKMSETKKEGNNLVKEHLFP
jgi:hypothetical protein